MKTPSRPATIVAADKLQREFAGQKSSATAPADGNRVVISFTHAENRLVAAGGPLKGFTIADKEGKFISAQFEIRGSTVVVFADQIQIPIAVRYGWDRVPDVNLFNHEGLSAVPFRTDFPAAFGN